MNGNITLLRLVLDYPGGVAYFPWYDGSEDYGDEPIPFLQAHKLLRQGIEVELAMADPDDKGRHYETDPVTFQHV